MIRYGRRPAFLCKGRGGAKYALGLSIPARACLRFEKNADFLKTHHELKSRLLPVGVENIHNTKNGGQDTGRNEDNPGAHL